ncbi:BZ3500_MvSof-1268-A1-R1_Chr4-2g07046 [Microbotryum saponariae]|uniref:BZ3500_MvSof-1268-A1-R1_Chr4-2g07046 protein n=1 Tax=Microbotryum saponariae TaxID=289078 RepID=A0A2X0MY16_9BASI|nr:BZ3500_MvSof-1268-A1-R1_Chr4-2g07046 [Microbotryum saponariae]SDA06711.1 BZ3501_MvSof-1269-A2-R1_Chr4-2g06757 [Microbotryum saponariae]
MSQALPPLAPPHQPQSIAPNELDAVRLKLVQLIDSIQLLLSQVHYLSSTVPTPSMQHPGLLSYNELISRYNLILSHVAALGGLLSSVGNPRESERRYRSGEPKRDPKAERWKGSLVVPAVSVEPAKDWVVGTLLRTKQTVEVENYLSELEESLPRVFKEEASRKRAMEEREKLVEGASERILSLKDGENGEEWDWRARVEVDEDDEESEMMQIEDNMEKRKWTVQEVATYQRTGKLPV